MIPDGDRRTACVSSQVGCPVGCKFCASGIGGVKGNLTAGQIVEQVYSVGPALYAVEQRSQYHVSRFVLGVILEYVVEQILGLVPMRFAAADPYVKHCLVKAFRVKQWHTVAGSGAAAPLRPEVVAAGRLK